MILEKVHCFGYKNFGLLLRSRKWVVITTAMLLLPPAIFCAVWYFFEHEEIPIKFQETFTGSMSVNNEDDFKQVVPKLTDAAYEYTKGMAAPIQFPQKNRDTLDFRTKVSKKFTEELGVFSSLPIYRVCLENRSVVLLGDKSYDVSTSTAGGVDIHQQQTGGYHFYALSGKNDCHNVVIEAFRNSTSTIEYAYAISWQISQEERIKQIAGQPFTVVIATSSVTSGSTKMIISLTPWILILSYVITLFAWSFVYFQYEKIFKYLSLQILKSHKKIGE
jgi:hypothetical protein